MAALRQAGHNVFWVRTEMGGATDEVVLTHAIAEGRVLLTFDKDFGDMVYRDGLPAPCGVLFFRIPTASPEYVVGRVLAVIGLRDDWSGLFTVVDQDQIRVRPLPEPRQ